MPRCRWIPRKAAAIGRDDVKNLEVNAGTRDDAVAQRKKTAKDLLVNEKNYDRKNEKN